MERKDLLLANAANFFCTRQEALNAVANRDCKILVVGNPANTNALIAQRNAPNLNPANFTAMLRLDHNRTISQLAEKTGKHVTQVSRVTVWGNHSATQYPDLHAAVVDGKTALSLVDQSWYADTFIPYRSATWRCCQSNNAAHRLLHRLHLRQLIICATGHWALHRVTGSAWAFLLMVATVLHRASSLRLPRHLQKRWQSIKLFKGLEINAFSRARIDATHKELLEEKDGVKDLI